MSDMWTYIVAYDPGDKQLAIGQFRFFPDPPFMLVADVAGFNRGINRCRQVAADHARLSRARDADNDEREN